MTHTAPDGSRTETTFLHGRKQTEKRFDADNAQVGAATYGYDSHGRLETVTDARTGTTTYTYTDADQVHTVTTPESAPGAGDAQTTTYVYDDRGRVKQLHLPDGTTQTFQYYSTGNLKSLTGARTYPVEYTYDSRGRRRTMTTWQDHAGQHGSATTTWHYNAKTGLLDRKEYDDGTHVDYTYWPSGRLWTRTWQRNIVTTYSYDEAGVRPLGSVINF